MSKIQILRQIVIAIAAINNHEGGYPQTVPCTETEWLDFRRGIKHDPRRGVLMTFNSGWEFDEQDALEFVSEHADFLEVMEELPLQGPLHYESSSFGIRGQDPWFRKVHPDYAWAAEWNK